MVDKNKPHIVHSHKRYCFHKCKAITKYTFCGYENENARDLSGFDHIYECTVCKARITGERRCEPDG